MKKVELLSPVGNMEMFYQAVHNGADAVYLSGTSYGARKFARNFTDDELIFVMKYAHLYGVKVYVTVNTLIYEYELDNVLKYLDFLYRNGVDAVIMQDIGLIYVTRKVYPNLEIHASTQCHNHNNAIVSLWKSLGITRVVMAREMSLEEIKKIDSSIEKEVFVYGALCVCYSGCCLFSSLNGGRSGNRGECVGSCRLPYKLIKNDTVVKTDGKYLLSTKELNTLEHVKELIEAGVASFKIEGRMKSPAYVGYVTRLYRKMIDKYYNDEDMKISDSEIFNLKKLFHRGFTDGYLFNDRDVMNIKTPNHLGVEIGKVVGINKGKIKIKLYGDGISQNDGIRFQNKNEGMMINRLYNEEMLLISKANKGDICYIDDRFDVKLGDIVLKTIDSNFIKELESFSLKKIPISMEIKCFLESKIELLVTDQVNSVTVSGDIVEKAVKKDVSEEDIRRQLSKLGDTPFVASDINIIKDDNVFVNLKALNEIRREAVAELVCLREKREVSYVKNTYQDNSFVGDGCRKVRLNVLVRNEEQLLCCLEQDVDDIYVTDYLLYLKYKSYDNVYYRLDRVNSNYFKLEGEKLLVGEMGSVFSYCQDNTLVGDYYLNVTNHYSIDFLMEHNIKRVTLSVELDDKKIFDILKRDYPIELVIYGRIEAMVMKYCPLKKLLNYCGCCKKSEDKFCLEDKFGNRYPMIRKNCLTYIMNHKVMDKIDAICDYRDMGVSFFRLELFDEDREEVINLIKRVRNYL